MEQKKNKVTVKEKTITIPKALFDLTSTKGSNSWPQISGKQASNSHSSLEWIPFTKALFNVCLRYSEGSPFITISHPYLSEDQRLYITVQISVQSTIF